MDHEQTKRQTRAAWSGLQYADLSALLRPASVALCDACAVSAGQEVLDVAAGDGNFAVACAEEGASVVASDLSPSMVEQGRARAEAEGVDIEWLEADVEELPFEDGRFECVGSAFGAMIAPRPRRTAEEMFRVTRPGNTVGMTAWMREGAAVEMFEIGRRFTPPEPEEHLHDEWSDEANVRERFDGLANSIEIEKATLPWSAGSPEEFVEIMERASPQGRARERLPAEEYERMREEMVALARQWAGGDGPFSVDVPYVIIVARRRG